MLRTDEPAIVHATYILANPVVAGLVETPAAWPYNGPKSLLEELAGEDRSEDLSVRVAELATEMEHTSRGKA